MEKWTGYAKRKQTVQAGSFKYQTVGSLLAGSAHYKGKQLYISREREFGSKRNTCIVT